MLQAQEKDFNSTTGLAEEVQLNTGKDFEVQAVVKPGANIKAIIIRQIQR
jgi:hypothetical protein